METNTRGNMSRVRFVLVSRGGGALAILLEIMFIVGKFCKKCTYNTGDVKIVKHV